MPLPISKIAINGSRRQDEHAATIASLITTLQQRGIKIVVSQKFNSYLAERRIFLSDIEICPLSQPPTGASLALSFGGDGTFLRTNRWVDRLEIPVAGVNTGHLGYLADYDLEKGIGWIDDILAGNYRVESRTMLGVKVDNLELPPSFPLVALNEVALLKRDTASMIELTATAGDTFLGSYRADGVLVSTPTGSTAYNLSVGGPILQPTVPALVIAPIAPHSIGQRPMVLSDDTKLRFCVKSRAETFLLSVDGNSYPLPSGSSIGITRALRRAKVVMRPCHDYADALRTKLQWG